MAIITWRNQAGEQVEGEITDAALESTAVLIQKQLEDMNSSLSSVGAILLSNATKETQGQKLSEAQHKENLKASKQLAEGIDDMNEEDKNSAFGEKFGAGLWGAAESVVVGFTGIISSTFGLFKEALFSTGNQLNDLTKVGVGFTDSSGSALSAMSDLSFSGLKAAEVLGKFSGVVQSIGKNDFANLTRSFLDATQSGADLGMSLGDSVERMGKELEMRQYIGVINSMDQVKLQAQVTRNIKVQQQYASVLGVSVDKLQEFSNRLITDTPKVAAALLSLAPEIRAKVSEGITAFGTVLRAAGGPEAEKFAAAMTEAAAGGALGFSDGMVDIVRNIPSLNGPLEAYITAFQNGTLETEKGQKIAAATIKQLGNLSKPEIDRLRGMSRAGNELADSLSAMALQASISSSKLASLGQLKLDGVQMFSNQVQTLISQFYEGINALKISFMEGVGAGNAIAEAFKAAKKTIFTAVGTAMSKFSGTADVVESLQGTVEGLGKKFAEILPGLITKLAGWIATFIEYMPTMIANFKSVGGAILTIAKVVGFMGAFGAGMVALTGIVGGVVLGLKILKVGLSSLGIGKAVGSTARAASSVAGNAAGGLGKLGTGISKGMGAIIGGLAKGLMAFANKSVVVGAAALAASIALIGAGVAGATWIMGAALPKMAAGMQSFEALNGEKLIAAGKGMGAIALGMAAFGASSAVSGLGSLVGSISSGIAGLFGGDDPLEKLQKFQEYNFDSARIENNANALLSYSSAISQISTMNVNITSGISGLFANASSLEKLQKFQEYNFDSARIENNANAVVGYSRAMAALGSSSATSGIGSLVGVVASSISQWFGNDDPFSKIKEFQEHNFDTAKIKNNAAAVRAYASAMGEESPTANIARNKHSPPPNSNITDSTDPELNRSNLDHVPAFRRINLARERINNAGSWNVPDATTGETSRAYPTREQREQVRAYMPNNQQNRQEQPNTEGNNARPRPETELLEELVKQSKQQNTLLKRGNKGVTDLSNVL